MIQPHKPIAQVEIFVEIKEREHHFVSMLLVTIQPARTKKGVLYDFKYTTI